MDRNVSSSGQREPHHFEHVCSLADGPGLDQWDCPPQPFSHPTSSRTGRSAAVVCARLPMQLAEEAVMHVHGSVEVGMALVVANGTKEEFAPWAYDSLACLRREPHAFAATTGTILRGAMGIDFDADHANGIRFFFRQLVDFAFQLIGLFAIAPPRFAAAFCFDRA